MANASDRNEMTQRWRLVLGVEAEECIPLDAADLALDGALSSLYDEKGQRGRMGASAPSVARWLGDIRQYFPSQVMQKDALERRGVQQMLCEPELLMAVESDMRLVATLLSLNRVMPTKTRATARLAVERVVRELEQKLASPLRQPVDGALHRAVGDRRPRHNEIDWLRTIRANGRRKRASCTPDFCTRKAKSPLRFN